MFIQAGYLYRRLTCERNLCKRKCNSLSKTIIINMGENCWIPGCGSSRRKEGIYFHKLPCMPVDAEWRKQIEGVIKKYREIDDALAARMGKGEIDTCERHFKSEDFYIRGHP